MLVLINDCCLWVVYVLVEHYDEESNNYNAEQNNYDVEQNNYDVDNIYDDGDQTS